MVGRVALGYRERPIQQGACAKIEHMRKYAQIVRCAQRYVNYAAFEKTQKQKPKQKQDKKPNRRYSKKKKNVQLFEDKKKRHRPSEAAEVNNEAKTLETAAMMRRWAQRKREGKPR